ncbi:solute carrier family 22 member 15-like [Tubulanus polymorphus]|uniref:solute carrier family 22 member 15-like n=1 Tax=Tubulanus polymorphus TaxID=672921 RepID=UPI003DA207AF
MATDGSSVGEGTVIYISEVDNVLKAVSMYGKRWVYTTCAMLSVSTSVTAWHVFAIVFIGGLPDDYHCRVGANQSIPQIYKDGKWTNDKCRMYKNESSGDNQTIPCNNGWVYYTDYQSTIVTEWDLVCDRDYLPQMAQTIFVVGTLVGAGSLSPLADWFGRKAVHIASQIGIAVFGIVVIFSPNYTVFAVMRFLSGICQQGIALTGNVMTFELFDKNVRYLFILALTVAWSLMVASLAAFAFLVRDWKHLQLLISIPGLLAIFGICCLTESIPWLIGRGRIVEAEEILRKVTKGPEIKLSVRDCGFQEEVTSNIRREKTLKTEITKRMKTLKLKCCKPKRKSHTRAPPAGSVDKKRETLWDQLKHPRLRWYSIIMCLMWLNSSIAYYGITLSATSLVGNRYLNFGLVALAEAPTFIYTSIASTKIGRRIASSFAQVAAGIALITVVFIPKSLSNGTSLAPLILTLTMVGMYLISCSFSLAYLYGKEIYPTSTRNSGMGLSSVCARVGGMLAPFAGYMVTKIYWFPGVFLGSISIIIGLLVLYLPEPLGRPIPQKIADMDSWTRQRYRPPTDDNMADEQLPALLKEREQEEDGRNNSVV